VRCLKPSITVYHATAQPVGMALHTESGSVAAGTMLPQSILEMNPCLGPVAAQIPCTTWTVRRMFAIDAWSLQAAVSSTCNSRQGWDGVHSLISYFCPGAFESSQPCLVNICILIAPAVGSPAGQSGSLAAQSHCKQGPAVWYLQPPTPTGGWKSENARRLGG
jgi:hypothetical protein